LAYTGKGQQKKKVCKICKSTYSGAKKTCSRAYSNYARTGITYTKEGKFDKAYRGTLLKEKLLNVTGYANVLTNPTMQFYKFIIKKNATRVALMHFQISSYCVQTVIQLIILEKVCFNKKKMIK